MSSTSIAGLADLRVESSTSLSERILLFAGVAAPATYIGLDLVAASIYPAYSLRDQAISELSATGAPTAGLWSMVSPIFAILLLAFAIGLWRLTRVRVLRVVAALMTALVALGPLWALFPMHQRGAATDAQDVGHLVLAGLSAAIITAFMVAGGIALGGWFRRLSFAMAIVVAASFLYTFALVGRLGANEATPWLGAIERVGIYGYLAWIAILTLALFGNRRTMFALTMTLAACGPAAESRRALDSLAGATSAHASLEAGSVLADRGEAQQYLDSARVFFLASDFEPTAHALVGAIAINREHAASAAEPAKTALLRSATELEALASRMMDRRVGSVAPMDSAFARLHLAEAQLHCTRAEVEWAQRQAGATGAEMLMLADHFERAARDVGYVFPAAVQQHVESLRSIAVLLSHTGLTKSAEVDIALSRIDKDVHVLIDLVGSARH
jgi:hypothetical protein